MNQSSPFIVPFTFPNISGLRVNESEPSETRSIIEASLLASRPTVIQCWGALGSQPECAEDGAGSGVVIGCDNGTLYVFQELVHPMEPPSSEVKPRPKSPLRVPRSSYSTSRSESPVTPSFALSPTYNISARSRVVSGVTAEQVEAPKNYVDFGDEPDKLKGMLKGKNPREKHLPSDASSEKNVSAVRSPAPSIIEPVPLSKRKSAPRSLMSATNSPAQTPRTLSTPTSPKEYSIIDYPSGLTLRYHIIPVQSGSGRAVKAIEMFKDNRFIAALQETGTLTIYSAEDGSCIASVQAGAVPVQASNGTKDRERPCDIWDWCSLRVFIVEQSTILLVTAATDVNTAAPTPDMEESSSEKSRTVMFELLTGTSLGPNVVNLERLGQWEFDGPAKGLGVHTEANKTSVLFSINTEGHFLVRQLQLRHEPPPPPVANSESEHFAHLVIPKPFKAMMSRSAEHLPANQDQPKLILQEVHDTGDLLSDSTLSGLATRHDHGKLYGIVWAHREMTVFEYHERSLQILYQTTISQLENVEWIDLEMYALSYRDRMEIYKLKLVNAENEAVDGAATKSGSPHVKPELLRTLPTGQHDASTFAPSSDLILVKLTSDGQRQLVSFQTGGDCDKPSPKESSRILWQSSLLEKDATPNVVLTSALPLELGVTIQGYSDGRLRQLSLAQMVRKGENASTLASSSIKTSEPALSGYITGLHVVQNTRTREKYVVGGCDDGSIAFWNMNTFELCARWIAFTTPMVKVVEFPDEKVGPLRGCVLCIAQDGTIAVIVVDGFHFLYLVPGAVASLKRICLGGNNLLLIYADHRARLWDVQTKEFWRSMGTDKAEEMMAQGGWTDLNLNADMCVPESEWSIVTDTFGGRDAVATLAFSLEKYVLESIALTKTISTSRNEIRDILLTLDRLRLILSMLLTPGLSEDVDSICTGKLKLSVSSAGVGFTSFDTTTLYVAVRPPDVWCISGNLSAVRMLSIVLVLRALSLFEELSEAAHTVISFYATSLGPCIGPQYKYPSLEYLGRRWFAASNELRQAIRVIFDATVSRLSDDNAVTVAEKWQHHVPSLQPAADRETLHAALALFICGCISSEKYSLLSTTALTDISKSITLYLHDENSSYRVLAIDLCSRGFHVWQHYIDTMEILRSLFTLATSVRKDSISAQNVGAQARLAVLSIASQNTPLFMSTLCLDVLTPPTLDHRKSVLQIVAFLIRKRPHILQPNLPRLMEAVVKSLDPNSNANREAVLDTATEIIGYVVKTFPTVDFHVANQRLAVGTNEGAVVMYDLKTAIRLYVLEGHRKQLTACSFSPDGRRLVTLSLEERLVLVWKVGSSFSSFFNPGAPPRQGHGGSQPYKTFNFNIGTEGDMTISETLDFVKFEWATDRSVKVKIRASILTFST